MIPKDDFWASWARVRFLTGFEHLVQLSKMLGVAPATVTKAKARGEFPGDWAAQIAVQFNSSADWILFGRGDANPNFREEVDWLNHLGREEREIFRGSPMACVPAFGEALKELRRSLNLSISTAAKIGNVSIDDYIDFERGFRPLPGIINAYAKYYKIDTKDLYDGKITRLK